MLPWQLAMSCRRGWKEAVRLLDAAARPQAAQARLFAKQAAEAGQPSAEVSPELAAQVFKTSMSRDPLGTASALFDQLNELDRVHLVVALQRTMARRDLEAKATAYLEGGPTRPAYNKPAAAQEAAAQGNAAVQALSESEIAGAQEWQRQLQRFPSHSTGRPTRRQLMAVALASGLPFLAFGFVDNSVMLIAGEQIDLALGTRLGITTLASAGLGNLVADVVGVSVSQQVQERANKALALLGTKPPKLSTLQQGLGCVKTAKFTGALLGVSIGCLLGMAPLAFGPPGFFDAGRA